MVRIAGALAIVLGMIAVAAAATTPGPNVAAMTLAPTDVPGAKTVSSGKVTKGGYLAAYQRTLKLATPYGRSAIVGIQSESMLGKTAKQVATDLAVVQRVFRSRDGRAAFAAGVAANFHVKRVAVKLGAVRHPRVGDGTVEQTLGIDVGSTPSYESLVYLRLDRVLMLIVAIAARPIASSDTVTLAKLAAAHVREQLVPVDVTLPTITGTIDLGQTLTAVPGTWSSGDVVFTYQWQRCDPVGQTCTDIPGETKSTYGVVGADAGSALRVVVTASDRFGAPTAESAVTAVVPVPPPPAP